MTDKFCVDCKHSKRSNCFDAMACRHPNNGFNLVTGEPKSFLASSFRVGEFQCGKEGEWFEPKLSNPPPPPKPPETRFMYDFSWKDPISWIAICIPVLVFFAMSVLIWEGIKWVLS